MNLLIPQGRISDKYLVRAAQEMGHRVYLMCNLQEPDRLGEVEKACQPDVWIPLPSRFELKLSHEDYASWYHEKIRVCVAYNEIIVILPCSSMDVVMDEVAMVNEDFTLLGIHPEQAEFFRDKTVYLPAMAEAGILVPKIYEIVEPNDEPKNYDLPYPVIAKPGLGCGGWGIYIASDEERLRWFFSASNNPSSFTDNALFYQDRDFAGEPKSYLHFGMGGRYLVQEYLDGPCISLAGTTSDGIPKLDLAYDIGITAPPTCAEINFGWPSAHRNIEAAITRLLASYSKCGTTFPDGAWMADTILHDRELWLVDFSVRMSSSGTKMLYHACGNLSYAKDVIHATLGDTWKITGTNPKFPTYYSFIPFPKGKISNVKYPDNNASYMNHKGDTRLVEIVTPIQGNGRVFEMRNDTQVADRGWIVSISNIGTRSNAQELVEQYIKGIKFDINT